jgi:ribosome biogenesis protein NSA1
VEVSIWDTKTRSQSWCAKNVPNDHLGLRQPVQNTSLAFISSDHHHLVVGSQLGHVRRYDARAAKKPIADWKKLAKVGGIRVVERAFGEHQILLSDQGANLYTLDLRTGKILYGYNGLAGAVTSIAPSPQHIASTSLDRYARIHSVTLPPERPGANLDRRGQVLDKFYLPRVPTCAAWAGESEVKPSQKQNIDDDDVWENMQTIE